jgi:hypothetical protein
MQRHVVLQLVTLSYSTLLARLDRRKTERTRKKKHLKEACEDGETSNPQEDKTFWQTEGKSQTNFFWLDAPLASKFYARWICGN